MKHIKLAQPGVCHCWRLSGNHVKDFKKNVGSNEWVLFSGINFLRQILLKYHVRSDLLVLKKSVFLKRTAANSLNPLNLVLILRNCVMQTSGKTRSSALGRWNFSFYGHGGRSVPPMLSILEIKHLHWISFFLHHKILNNLVNGVLQRCACMWG